MRFRLPSHAIAIALAAFAAPTASAQSPGLTVSDEGTLLKDGAPYRGIGVNYFDAFLQQLLDRDSTDHEADFAELARRGIPFVRFAATGFYPTELRVYLDDRDAYLGKMDNVVRTAEQHGIGLIPSFFWADFCVPDLMGDPRSAWGDPSSKTIAHMRRYVRDIVSRYKDSPAIWAWEFGNEYDLGADLPNAADHRPPVLPHLGTPAKRGPADDLTQEMVRTAFVEFGKAVRGVDSHRALVTGNAIPRPSIYHMRTEGTWDIDTREEFIGEFLALNPDPIDTLCIHVYPEGPGRFGEASLTYGDVLSVCMEASRRAKKPLFIGEFGANHAESAGGPTKARAEVEAMLAAIESTGTPLAAFWVFDLSNQDESYNVDATNARAYVLDLLEAANARLRGTQAAAEGK